MRRRWKIILGAVVVLGVGLLWWAPWQTPPLPTWAFRPTDLPAGVTLVPVEVDGLDGDFFHGTATHPQRAVILLSGSEGGRSWSHATKFINALIDRDFCVLSLAYFGTERLPRHLREIPLEYFDRAFAWLAAQSDRVIPGRYALIGGSRGAELALLLASRIPEVKVVVALSPASVAFPGAGSLAAGFHSAWSENGRELPFVPVAGSVATAWSFVSGRNWTRAFENALADKEAVERAAISVEKIQGAVLLMSFTRDETWPSVAMGEQIEERWRLHGYSFPHQHVSMEAGHCQWWIKPGPRTIVDFLQDHFPASFTREVGSGPMDVPGLDSGG